MPDKLKKYDVMGEEEILTSLGGIKDKNSQVYNDLKDVLRQRYSTNPQNNTTNLANNYERQINDMFDQQRSARLSALQNRANQQISALDRQKQSIAPAFQNERSDADVKSIQATQRLREMLAAQGTAEGDNISANARLQAQRGQTMANIGQRETQAFNNIASQQANIRNALAIDEQTLANELASARTQALLNAQMQQDEQGFNRNLALANLTGNFNGQRTLQGQQFDYNMDPNNPQVQAQMLNNQINQLKLQNLPREQQLELARLQQLVNTGNIDMQQAQYQLNQLLDPNSVYNQQNNLQLQQLQQNVQANQQLLDNTPNEDGVTSQEVRNIFLEAYANGDLSGAIIFLNNNEEYIKNLPNGRELYNELNKKVEEAKKALSTFY